MLKKPGIVVAWLLAALLAMPIHAAERPYNEKADAKADIAQALTDANKVHLPVLLVFGANWCEDCRALDHALKAGKSAELMAREFKVVKIDVGNFNRNLDVTASYGNPIKEGIPAAVILSADHKVLYATRAGELANARRMDDSGLHQFFSAALAHAQATSAGKPSGNVNP